MGSPALPEPVLARLGASPAVVTGEGGGIVARGNGFVAKAGAPTDIAREVLVLHEIVAALPVEVPSAIECGDTWFVAEEVADSDEAWSPDEVQGAIADLAALHRRFAGADVVDDARLIDPLGPGLQDGLRMARAIAALDAILPGAAAVAADPTPLLDALSPGPVTLLHGDPWPGNVHRPAHGRRVWVDWASAARGPAALDVATWLDQAPWVLEGPDDPSADEQFDIYCAEANLGSAEREAFRRAVDAATVLWFLVMDVPRLPVIRHAPATVERLLAPRRAAMERLGIQ